MFSIPCFLRPIHSRKIFQSFSVTSTVKLSLLPSIKPATTSLLWLPPSARIARLPTKSVNFIYERTVLNKYLMILLRADSIFIASTHMARRRKHQWIWIAFDIFSCFLLPHKVCIVVLQLSLRGGISFESTLAGYWRFATALWVRLSRQPVVLALAAIAWKL